MAEAGWSQVRVLGDPSESSGEPRSSALRPSQAELWGKWGTHEGVTAEMKPQADFCVPGWNGGNMVARLGEVGRPTRPQWVGVIRMEMRPVWMLP